MDRAGITGRHRSCADIEVDTRFTGEDRVVATVAADLCAVGRCHAAGFVCCARVAAMLHARWRACGVRLKVLCQPNRPGCHSRSSGVPDQSVRSRGTGRSSGRRGMCSTEWEFCVIHRPRARCVVHVSGALATLREGSTVAEMETRCGLWAELWRTVTSRPGRVRESRMNSAWAGTHRS